MPSPLNLLPSDVTIESVRAVAAALPEKPPLVPFAPRQQLMHREARIFVGATGSGKSTMNAEQGFVADFDDNGQSDDATVIARIVELLRKERQTPAFKPVILLRNATWHRIEPHFYWLDKLTFVSRVSFPQEMFEQALTVAGAPDWFTHTYLTRRFYDSCRDARDHFLPAFAWRAVKALGHGKALTTAKPHALAVAGLDLVRTSPTAKQFLRHMAFVVPDSANVAVRGEKLALMRRLLSPRLLTSMRYAPLPNGWTRKEFIEAAIAEGIWKKGKNGETVFGQPFAAGYVAHKKSLLHAVVNDTGDV